MGSTLNGFDQFYDHDENFNANNITNTRNKISDGYYKLWFKRKISLDNVNDMEMESMRGFKIRWNRTPKIEDNYIPVYERSKYSIFFSRYLDQNHSYGGGVWW